VLKDEGLRWHLQWDPKKLSLGGCSAGTGSRSGWRLTASSRGRRTPEEVARARSRAPPILAEPDQLAAMQEPQANPPHDSAAVDDLVTPSRLKRLLAITDRAQF